jgi:cystathionine gamma-synthase
MASLFLSPGRGFSFGRKNTMPSNDHSSEPSAAAQGPSTRSVHAGENRLKPGHALIEPVFQTSTYTFENMAEVVAFQEVHAWGGHVDRFEYGRYGNPTVAAAEARLAALENAEGAIQVASGMAALTFTFLHLLPTGSHIIITDDSYRRTRQFCETYLHRLGIATTVVPLGDFDALEAAIRPQTRVLFSETPSNPYMRILDLERFAEIGKRRKLTTVIDATLATPINLRPLEWGVDLITHSATKYLGGHNDLLAGFVAGRAELIAPLRETIGILGGISDPNTAALLIRGMKTLALRVQQQNRSAQQVAEFLAQHPAVEAVYYPGLETHPGHAIAARQMTGCGGLLSFKVRGGQAAAFKFIDALKLAYLSPSLGGTETLVLHPGVFAYYDMDPEERSAAGMADNLVRLAVGIEDAQDLIADLGQALEQIKT